MANVGYDGQSLMMDGQRVWLVSGSIAFAGAPRASWARRIAAAKQAGLNCIDVSVCWSLHEKSPGKFDFSGDADLRAFVKLIAEAGMYCILRPGPHIGGGYDFGGMPGWLSRISGMRVRQANGPFLEACSRYFSAVFEPLLDLQASSPGGGPLILVQAEQSWLCDRDDEKDSYLQELVRYLREAGCTVPITCCNNLWARIEGAWDTWCAAEHLAADLRQLRVVQPDAPRMVSSLGMGETGRWGRPAADPPDAGELSHRLAQVLAAGAQYNLDPFHAVTRVGFLAGATPAGEFVTTSADHESIVSDSGERGGLFNAVKKISTFASQFGHLFAHTDPTGAGAVIRPDARGGISVIHLHGAQGAIVFLLRMQAEKTRNVDILLPNGLTLPVDMGDDRAAWLVTDANLGGVAELNWTNLRPWAFVGKRLLALFGPAGSDGMVCVNNAAMHVTIPEGDDPHVQQHEGLTIVVFNETQVDAAYVSTDGIVLGDRRINLSGEIQTTKPTASRRPTPPKLGDWSCATLGALLDGSAPAFTEIEGPHSLEQLHHDHGYGWYRIDNRKAAAGQLLLPQAGDRLHVFESGNRLALLGAGPGAQHDPMKGHWPALAVVLADNLGRPGDGWRVGEPRGLYGHVQDVTQLRAGKPTVIAGRAPNIFELGYYFLHMRAGDRPPADTWRWQFTSTSQQAYIVDLTGFPHAAVLVANDEAIGAYHPQFGGGSARFLLPARRGKRIIDLALFEKIKVTDALLASIRIYKAAEITNKAKWAHAPWKTPPSGDFAELPRSTSGLPCWFHAAFNITSADHTLRLDPAGMSKGQIYLNGHNVGRYFVATGEGKAVPGQSLYDLPESWLRTDKPNELMLFDEHGRLPKRVRLVW